MNEFRTNGKSGLRQVTRTRSIDGKDAFDILRRLADGHISGSIDHSVGLETFDHF